MRRLPNRLCQDPAAKPRRLRRPTRAKAVSPWRSQAGPDRCRAATGRRGRGGGGQRPRGRPPRRGLAGGTVPAFSEPRRPDAGGGGGGAAAVPRRDRGGAGRGAGRRSARPLSLPRPGLPALGDAQPDPFRDHFQPPAFDHDKAEALSRDNAELIELTGARWPRPLLRASCAGRPETGPDRRAGAGLWLCPDEYRRPFSALGCRRAEAEQTAEAILDLFIEGIAKRT